VLLTGTWDHAKSILVGPRVRDGANGFHLVTPLVRADGSTVLVDRGFVTRELAETALQATDAGGVQVLGMLRTSQVRNQFTPDNHPEKGEWYWVDVDAMAQHAGGEAAGVQPVFVEAIFGAFSLCALIDFCILNRMLSRRGTRRRGIIKSRSRHSCWSVSRRGPSKLAPVLCGDLVRYNNTQSCLRALTVPQVLFVSLHRVHVCTVDVEKSAHSWSDASLRSESMLTMAACFAYVTNVFNHISGALS
jgi:hypothetical protein